MCSYDSEEERRLARGKAARHGAALRAQAAAQAELLAAYQARARLKERLEEEALRTKLQQQARLGEGGWRHDVHGPDASRPSGDGAAAGPAQARAWLRAVQQHERQWAALEASCGREDGAGGGYGSSDDSRPAGTSSSTGGEAGAGLVLTLADVPWPPLAPSEYLAGLAALEQQEHRQQQQQGPALRQQGPAAQRQPRPQQGAAAAEQHRQQKEAPSCARAQRRAYARACLRWHPDKFSARWGTRLAEGEREAILERVHHLSQGLNEAWAAAQDGAG